MNSEIKKKIDAIWQGMWDNSMADAKTNITQITYLLFIKMLDDAQIKKERNANALHVKLSNPTFAEGIYLDNVSYEDLRWHNFVHFDNAKMYRIVKDYVFKFIREMNDGEDNAFSRFMGDAKLDIPNGKILEKVVRGLDDEALSLDNKEIMGDVYEYLLSKLSVNGTNGQFRTPRHIIRMMVELMKPKLGEVICDPAMGSAGFLMEAAKYVHDNQKDELNEKENRDKFNSKMFFGNETDPDMLRIGTMNMTLHDVSDPQIFYKNSLTDDNKDEFKYDLILANPPFSGSLDANDLSKSIKDICPSKSTELLFMALFLRSLKIGGRCASIVPVGVLNNINEKAYTTIRQNLVEKQKLRSIIYMPSGVFKPYSGVQTAIVIFDKTDNGGTDKVWIYNMENDGYSLDDKREELKESDIPDIINRFSNLELENERTPYEKSFFITKDEIVANNYVLSLKDYKKVEHEVKTFRNSIDLIEEINELELEFRKIMEDIKGDII